MGCWKPMIAGSRRTVKRRYFRGDAAFANPEVYEFLESEGMGYTIRLPANRVLQAKIGHLLDRPVGPPHEVRRYYASFGSQAESWKKLRRVVTKVEWHPGELIPAVALSSPTWRGRPSRVTASYNQRGTAEQWFKEGRLRSGRRDCHAVPSPPMRLAVSSMRWLTSSASSCEPWRCPRQPNRDP